MKLILYNQIRSGNTVAVFQTEYGLCFRPVRQHGKLINCSQKKRRCFFIYILINNIQRKLISVLRKFTMMHTVAALEDNSFASSFYNFFISGSFSEFSAFANHTHLCSAPGTFQHYKRIAIASSAVELVVRNNCIRHFVRRSLSSDPQTNGYSVCSEQFFFFFTNGFACADH